MKRAGIYNRCSTEEEAQINALESQAAESREIVIGKGWEIADQYIESESGTTSYKRSEYQRLLEDMESDKFDIVVIKSIDRLMRSAKDWYIFIDKLTQNNKQLYIYIDHKFYTPEDSLLTGIKAILAEDFSRELSKKIKNAHKRRQEKKSGLNITRPMFGWDKVGRNEFVINEKEAEAYRFAFALAKEGKGFYTIANIMYHNGVRGKNGQRISDVQWRKMIYTPRAHGTMILHTTEYDFETKKRIKLPERDWIFIENALPPIIDKEYHREILEYILCRTSGDAIKHGIRDRTSAGLYELSGKIYCGACGEVYYRTSFASGNRRLTEWKCSKALKQGRKNESNPEGCNNINVIEDVVLEIIEETCKEHYEALFGKEENIADEALFIIRKVISQSDRDQERFRLEKELEKYEKKKKVLFDKLMEDVICDADFKMANQGLSDNIERLQDKIEKIKSRDNEYGDSEKRLFEIKQSLNDEVFDKAKTKALINRMDKIIIYPDSTLEIVFNKLKMLSLLKICDAGLAEDALDDSFFRIMIPYRYQRNFIKRREEVNNEILRIFRENPELLLKDVYNLIEMSESYINTSVRQLKESGMLKYERNGNKHTGRWIVNGSE